MPFEGVAATYFQTGKAFGNACPILPDHQVFQEKPEIQIFLRVRGSL